jgi:hypothetical protein
MDLGLGVLDEKERFRRYRRFLYRAGAIDHGKGVVMDATLLEKEQKRDFKLPSGRRLLYRTRYFTDSAIIGTREYVRRTYRQVEDRFGAKRDKVPKPISGFDGIYSLKRLTE